MKINKTRQLVLAAVLLGVSVSSHAGLISAGPVNLSGTGLGAVNTVLTLQNNNNAGTAYGKIAYTATGDQATGSEVHPQKNATYAFADLNITNLQNLMLVFNPNEQGNARNNGLTLNELTLSIYSASGAFKQSFDLRDGPVTYDATETGTGTSGFGFKLDPAQMLPAILGTDRIGLSARLLGAEGGLDTFFVLGLEDEGPSNEVPEPGSLALLGLGIAGMTALRRRGRKARTSLQ